MSSHVSGGVWAIALFTLPLLAIVGGCAIFHGAKVEPKTRLYQTEVAYLTAARVISDEIDAGQLTPADARRILQVIPIADAALAVAKSHVDGGDVFDSAISQVVELTAKLKNRSP